MKYATYVMIGLGSNTHLVQLREVVPECGYQRQPVVTGGVVKVVTCSRPKGHPGKHNAVVR